MVRMIFNFFQIFKGLLGRLRQVKQDYNKIAEWNGNEIILLNGLILKVNQFKLASIILNIKPN